MAPGGPTPAVRMYLDHLGRKARSGAADTYPSRFDDFSYETEEYKVNGFRSPDARMCQDQPGRIARSGAADTYPPWV